jgi:sulfite reductase alpha subunit-like flavoprotein
MHSEKRYVQHALNGESQLIWNILSEKSGVIYVCGSASGLAKSVSDTIHEIVRKKGARSETLAKEYVGMLRECGRYVEDVW